MDKNGNLGIFGAWVCQGACPSLSPRTRGRDCPPQGIFGTRVRAGRCHLQVTQVLSPPCPDRICHPGVNPGLWLPLQTPGWSLWPPSPSWPCWCWPWDTPTPLWTSTGSSGKNPTARNITPRWEIMSLGGSWGCPGNPGVSWEYLGVSWECARSVQGILRCPGNVTGGGGAGGA